jgi:hypothetical protein
VVKRFKAFEVGDVVTAYEPGFWRITEIIPRYFTRDRTGRPTVPATPDTPGAENVPVFAYEKVLDADFSIPEFAATSFCVYSRCRKITVGEIEVMKQEYADGMERLKVLLPDAAVQVKDFLRSLADRKREVQF